MNTEKLIKKLYNVFKISGFNIRREFCVLIIEKFANEHIDLEDKFLFENCVKNITSSLEKQAIHGRSIELENIERAIEVCFNSGQEKHETIFNVINAFNFPKLIYDPDRKRYREPTKRPCLLSNADSKAQLFLDRYATILQRTQRNFKNKFENTKENIELQTVDYLLTLTHINLDKILILGSLIQITEGKYYLEDPTGMVELDLTHANFQGGFFVENIFVLANGSYEDKKLVVASILLPPGEEWKYSKLTFSNLNYFGGESSSCLRESHALDEHLNRNPDSMILFFSDLWLDYPNVFEKLEALFKGMEPNPPVAFIFMGNFIHETQNAERMDFLKKLFKQFGELVAQFPSLINNSKFVFVPGLLDPCIPHLVPKLPLPTCVTSELVRYIPKAIFATNPCRLQFCNKEIVLFRGDVLVKLMQGSLYKPTKEELAENLARTIISQGHLSPMSLNALTVNWDYDHTLRLYPLPNLVVIGDKAESYLGQYKGCKITNPGSFCESGFQFKCYIPYSDVIEDCVL